MRTRLLSSHLATFAVLGLAGLGACSDQTLVDDPVRDSTAPLIAIITPTRGAVSGNVSAVTVTGTVSDDDSGVASLTINGVNASIDSDGNFTAVVPTAPGTNILKTVATDNAGNQSSDTRSTLTGVLTPTNKPLENSLALSMSSQAFAAIGDAAANYVATADLTALMSSNNPVVNAGDPNGPDCLYITASLTYMDVGTSTINIVPVNGGLTLDVLLNDINIDIHSDYAAACINGHTDVTVHADSLHVTGMLNFANAGTDFDITLQNSNVNFENLNIDATGLPGDVLDLFTWTDTMNSIANWAANKFVAPAVNKGLAGLNGTKTFTVLGKQVEMTVSPQVMNFTPAGAQIQLNTTVHVDGSDNGPGFVYTEDQLPTLDANGGFKIAVADDLTNELLSSFWAANSMNEHIDFTTGSYGAVGQLFDSVDIVAMLPPTLTARNGELGLVVGDLVATFNLGDQAVTKIAINGSLSVKASEATGSMQMGVTNPDIKVDILKEGVTGTNALSSDAFAEIISFAATRLVGTAGSLMGSVKLPSVGGLTISSLSVEGTDGYLMVDGVLSDN